MVKLGINVHKTGGQLSHQSFLKIEKSDTWPMTAST